MEALLAPSELLSGIWHIGWGAEDMQSAYQQQLAKGTRFATPITDISDMVGGNRAFFYAYVDGPDHVREHHVGRRVVELQGRCASCHLIEGVNTDTYEGADQESGAAPNLTHFARSSETVSMSTNVPFLARAIASASSAVVGPSCSCLRSLTPWT